MKRRSFVLAGLGAAALSAQNQQRWRSRIMVFDLQSRTARRVYEADRLIEAPNWSRDGRYLLVNSGGNLYRLPLNETAPQLQKLELSLAGLRCNNDHDLSFDGRLLAFSASSPESRQSQVYVAQADGSAVKLITEDAPSYFHGWSPDGRWLAFVGRRVGQFQIYRIPSTGGREERLTSMGGYDDGPEYTPDGRWIYFNSNRGGGWNIWRMPPAGAGPDDRFANPVTTDAWEDWFPHISPDGKHLLFLSFPPGTEGHGERMPGMALRMMPAPGSKVVPVQPDVLYRFFGGQGTINVNSWAPDSSRFAFVEYQPLAAR